MDIERFRDERNSARILSFGFDDLGSGECISISQVGTMATVCLDLTAGLSEWKEILSRLTQVESRLVWVTLVGYQADEYTYRQLKLLAHLQTALKCLGARHIELPQALKARYRGFWYEELEEPYEPPNGIAGLIAAFA